MENQRPTKEQLMFAYDAIGKLQDYALTRHLCINTVSALDPEDHEIHFRVFDFAREDSSIYDGPVIAISDSDAIAEEVEQIKAEIKDYIDRKYESYADDDSE